MVERIEVRLAWAYVAADEAGSAAAAVAAVDGARRLLEGTLHLLVPVAAYRALPPRRRPRSFCPVCLERVWMKLGTRNRAHYAHLAGSQCAAARGEGALHHAAKIHLAEQLGRGIPVVVRPLCHRVPEERSTERCTAAPETPWPVRWDEVRVEHSLPSLRADLVLMRDGSVVAAVEVYASNAVDDVRAARYRELGIPWIEVPARGVLPEHGVAWTPDAPLPILGDSRLHPEVWRCPRHEGLHRGLMEYERNGVHRVARRVVHIYRTGAGRSAAETRCRAVGVSILERREDGVPAESWMERDDSGARIGFPVRGRDRVEARRILHTQFAEWARWTREKQSATLDSPMRWLEAADAPVRSELLYPQRLRWDAHAGTFRGVPDLPPLAWPALPALPGEPHPVLGLPRCWTETHRRGPVLHAVDGPVWLTLVQHAWTDAEGPAARADLAAFVHDGRRWRTVEGAPFTATVRAPAPWTEILAALARTLAARDPASLLDGVAVREAMASELAATKAQSPPSRTGSSGSRDISLSS
jgi:hypothetical protein